jgi:hypothetical protein
MASPVAAKRLHHLIAEALNNDAAAVEQVEQLIEALREQQRAAQAWQPAAPEWCDYGRIPHC